jgi:hypothetical protein
MSPRSQFAEGGPHEGHRRTLDGKPKGLKKASAFARCWFHETARNWLMIGGWRLVSVVAVFWALVGFVPAPVDSQIEFPGNTTVPRAVQQFAWRVIETRCNYQSYEREQRSFWAYNVETSKSGTGVAYSIHVVSDLRWKKTNPPSTIDMTVVDDGSIRLTSLKSKFVVCESPLS